MTQPNPNNPSPEMIEAEIFRFLDRKYVQTADERQSSMGLQYMEAETHDLARQFAKLYLAMTHPNPNNPSPEKIWPRRSATGDAAADANRGASMNAPLRIPPMAADDRLPHDKAVWRAVPIDGHPPTAAGSKQVSIEFHDGSIISDWAHQVSWLGAKRWRFGWAPVA